MDIATLGISIDSSEAASAATDLDRMVQAGARAERSAESVGDAMAGAGAKFSNASQQSERMKRALEQGSDAMRKQQAELAALLGKIDPVVGALGRLDEMESQLRKHAASGVLPADDFAEYSAKITEMRTRLAGADDQMRISGMTAKQTANSLRMLPMQFTDIAVSLAGGQSPFMVMMQQGGQLKDMFGGVGPAARAMGGYIAGLVNPFTIAATAAGALAFAYYKGSKEQDAYIKAVRDTNNAVGLTVGSMADMASRIGAVSGTTGEAAEAIAALAATGQVAGSSLERLGSTVSGFSSAAGADVKTLVDDFAALGKDPVDAAVKLDEKYRFLTAAVYEQIKSLDEQGRATDAANVAQQALADTLDRRKGEIVQNLGYIEGAWDKIKRAINGAGDAMLEFGRQSTAAQTLAQKRTELARLDAGGQGAGSRVGKALPGMDSRRKTLQDEIAALESDMRRAQADASREAEKEGRRRDDVRMRVESDAWAKANRTRHQQRDDELKAQKTFLDKKVITQEEYEHRVSAIQDKYKDPKERTRKARATTDDLGTRMLQQYREREALLKSEMLSTDKLTESQKDLAKFEQLVTDLVEKRKKGALTADQKSLLAKEDEIRKQLQLTAGLEEEKQKREALQKLNERALQIQAAIASAQENRQEQYDRELAAIGMGSKDQQRTAGMAQLVTEYRRYQDQLAKKADFGEIEPVEYQKRKDEIQAQLGIELAMYEQHYSDIDAAQARWANGASQAIADYVESGRNMSSQMNGLFTNAFSGMEDALTQFVKTGKLSFADLADSIISDLIRMSARAAISPLANMLGSAIGSWVGNGSLGSANMVDNGQALGSMFATGGHVSGPGTGTSDSIPAWLSNGEYVINAAAVQRYGKGTFDRLNAQKFATGGHVGPAANDASAVPNVRLELINRSSQPVTATQGEMRFDGKSYVQQIFLDDMRRGGPMSRAMGRR